eukprot:UN30942
MGFRRYQYCVLSFTGMVWMSDSMEIIILSFIVEEIGDEWNLGGWQVILLISSVLIGAIFGGLVFGFMSDTQGRRPTFQLSLTTCAVFATLSALATGPYILTVLRAGVGFGLGGASISYVYFVESVPTAGRGGYLMVQEMFEVTGSLVP